MTVKKLDYSLVLGKLTNALPRRFPLITKGGDSSASALFIMGSGRNGSTMLGSMLNMHPSILLVPEQFALFYAIQRFKLLNFLDWKDLVKIVVGEFSRKKASHWDVDIAGIYDDLYEVPSENRSLQLILDSIYKEYGKVKAIPYKVWGDKTPKNVLHVESIFPVFPRAKYVFLIRDGRDVLSSYCKSKEEYMGEFSHPENAVKLWNESTQAYDYLKNNCQKN